MVILNSTAGCQCSKLQNTIENKSHGDTCWPGGTNAAFCFARKRNIPWLQLVKYRLTEVSKSTWWEWWEWKTQQGKQRCDSWTQTLHLHVSPFGSCGRLLLTHFCRLMPLETPLQSSTTPFVLWWVWLKAPENTRFCDSPVNESWEVFPDIKIKLKVLC